MPESCSHGRFVWYDLMTTDTAAAQAFYTRLLGWQVETFEGAGSPYPMWTLGGVGLGGSNELPAEARAAGARPHWLAYVTTPDVDAAARRAAELGGKVMVPPSDIPTVGRFAVLADPAGAVFSAFAPMEGEAQAEEAPKVGQFSWHELATTDYEATLSFYGELFAWEKKEVHDMGAMGHYVIYGRQGSPVPLGGVFNKPEGMPASWTFYVRVADIQAATQKVGELGGKVLNGPMEVPGGDWITQCQDPQGAVFALHASAAAK